MDGLHDPGGKQAFGSSEVSVGSHNENWRPLVRALHAFAIESQHLPTMWMALRRSRCATTPAAVRGVVVHVVTIADLARPAMAASVMRNDAEPFSRK